MIYASKKGIPPMSQLSLPIIRLVDDLPMPQRAHHDDAGVNYGEAKDLPASCFMDRTRTEPKVNLLAWPSYAYLHRS